MTTSNETTFTSVTMSGIGVTAVIFFRDAMTHMIPWLIASFPLILLDLNFGIKAAIARGENVRFSKGFRQTFGKIVEYFAWCAFAATASIAFERQWIEWLVLGAVYGNELASIVGNYLETKGVELSFIDIIRLAFRKLAGKVDIEVGKEEAEEIIKPKPQRDAKGRFIKKSN